MDCAGQLTKQLLERAMQAELTHQLGYSKNEVAPPEQANRRNGASLKKVKSSSGELQIEIPRDRAGEYEPIIIAKHERRFDGVDDNIISLYSRGLSTREIQVHLEEIYGVEVSPNLISIVTEEVQAEVLQWQNRPLSKLYLITYWDALRINIRKDRRVVKCAVYVAIGVNLLGRKNCLGLWVSENEGTKFWLSVLTQLKNRGLEDILIVCTDGLKGFPEAIEAIYLQAMTQTCKVIREQRLHCVIFCKNGVSQKRLKQDCKP